MSRQELSGIGGCHGRLAMQEGGWGDMVGAIMCQLVELHSTLARYWVWLTDWYREKDEEVKKFWTLMRAKEVGRLGFQVQCEM